MESRRPVAKAPALACPRCKQPLAMPAADAPGPAISCQACGCVVRAVENGVSYDHAALLEAHDPQRYRLYRALCNNGFVSYHELAEGSVSLPERKDVAEFGQFLSTQIADEAVVLDIGCGPLPVPGYLVPLQPKRVQMLGLDVFATRFEGFRIMGCAEFLPLPNAQLDAVVFATSLDHVCDLARVLREARRVLRPQGRCFIWMSDRKPYWRQFFFERGDGAGPLRAFLWELPRQIAANLRHGRRALYGITHWFRHGRYWDYPNGVVFYCPPGAIDPFHAWFESPAEVAALARQAGFAGSAVTPASNGVFLRLDAS